MRLILTLRKEEEIKEEKNEKNVSMVYNGCKDGIFYKKVYLSTANCILNHANLKHLYKTTAESKGPNTL